MGPGKILAQSTLMAQLRRFSLRDSPVSGAGVVALVSALRCVEVLSFEGTACGDRGARAIAGSSNSSKLRYLDLSRTGLSDAGATALLESKHLENLEALSRSRGSLSNGLDLALRARLSRNRTRSRSD